MLSNWLWKFLFAPVILWADEGEAAGNVGGNGADPAAGGGDAGGGEPPLAAGGDPAGGGTDNPDAGTAPAWFRGLYDEQGKIDQSRFDALPENLKPFKDIFRQYQSVDALLHGMGSAKQLVGKKRSEVLSSGTDEERLEALRVLNRVPESPDKYPIAKPEELPEGVVWRDEDVAKYREVFHKHNAPPELVEELVQLNLQQQAKLAEEQKEKINAFHEEQQQILKNKFRAGYDQLKADAQRAAEKYGFNLDDFSTAQNVEAMAQLGRELGEDRSIGEGNPNFQNDRQKALSIVNNKNDPLYEAYHDSMHPQHDYAVALKSSLTDRWIKTQKKSGAGAGA